MPQAIVDPGELRRFAQNLKQFNTELQTQLAALHGQLLNLGSTWRDQEHHKFAEEFEHTLLVVNHFIEAADQHIPFLMRKADRVEEYLQQR
jgi:WXG100 family type VII secretion target